MASYEDILASLSPNDMDKRDALTRSLMTAAAQALQGGPNTGSVLGRTMFAGMQGYDDSIAAKRKERLEQMLARKQAFELAQSEQSIEDKKALAEAMRASVASPGGTFAPGTRQSAAFSPEANASLPAAPSAGAKDQRRMMLNSTIDRLVSSGRGDLAGPLQAELAKLEPELKNVRTGSIGGKRVTIKEFKDGTEQVSPYDPDLEKLHFADTGGATAVGVDQFTGKTVTPGLKKTLTPGEQASNSLGWFNATKPILQDTGSGFAAVSTPASGGLNVTGMPGLSSPKAREDADALRREFNTLPQVKNFSDIAPIYNAAAKAPNTPAGDLQLIYGVGKILDPASAVREGEFKMAAEAGSPAQRLQGYLDYMRGNGRLTPALRTQLTDMLHNAVDERKNQYQQARQTYSGLATQRGYDPAQIFIGTPEVAERPKAGGEAPVASALAAPKPGLTRNGYVFIGGDPADPKSWKPQ